MHHSQLECERGLNNSERKKVVKDNLYCGVCKRQNYIFVDDQIVEKTLGSEFVDNFAQGTSRVGAMLAVYGVVCEFLWLILNSEEILSLQELRLTA
jgi:uncharacterized protein YuzB (UPF0349 family)